MTSLSSEISPNRLMAGKARRRLLEDTLLGYLESNQSYPWPGVDGLTLHDVLDTYLQASTSGRVPRWQELARLHPDLSDELEAFFAR